MNVIVVVRICCFHIMRHMPWYLSVCRSLCSVVVPHKVDHLLKVFFYFRELLLYCGIQVNHLQTKEQLYVAEAAAQVVVMVAPVVFDQKRDLITMLYLSHFPHKMRVKNLIKDM